VSPVDAIPVITANFVKSRLEIIFHSQRDTSNWIAATLNKILVELLALR